MGILVCFAGLLPLLFPDDAPRVVVRIPQASPSAPKSFAFGIPFERGRIPGTPSFRGTGGDGGRVLLRCAKMSQWPDGSAHWVFFEGRATQEKLAFVFDPAVCDGGVFSKSKSVSLSAAPTGAPLFRVEAPETTLQGELRVLTPRGAVLGSEGARDVFEEGWGGATRSFRVQGSLGELRFDLRLAPRFGESRLDLEILVQNPTRQPHEVEDLECVLSLDERAWSFWTGRADVVSSLRNPKTVLREGSQLGAKSSPAECFCMEGRGAVSFLACGIKELFPKEILLTPQGKIHLRLLAGKAVIPAEGAVSWKIPFAFHASQDCEEASLTRIWRNLRAVGVAQVIAKESRGLDARFFPGDVPELAPFENLIEEGVQRLRLEMSEHLGWRDYGDHTLYQRWANLEFDTAAGLLWHGWRRGDEGCLRLAIDALEHWKTQDRFFSPVGDDKRCLPAVHGKHHAAGSGFENGHLWVEGLLRHFAMTGDLSSREAALDLGDALLLARAWGREDGRGVERHWAWPLIAFSALQEFFPERGYDRAMEEIVEEMLLRFHNASGFFLFDGRLQREEGTGDVNFWLSGGLLLEALAKYQEAGGKRDVLPVMKVLREAILREGWDGKRQRFLRAAELDLATGAVTDRWGTIKAVREIYLLAGLMRVREDARGEGAWRLGRRRLRDLVEKFRWPKESVGNDLSLLLRAEPAFFLSFSEL